MKPREEENYELRFATLSELGASTDHPLGIRAFVDEDRSVYINVGRASDEVAQLLGWGKRSIWMPDHVFAYVEEQHPVLIDPINTANHLLRNPDAIYRDDRITAGRAFIIEGSRLRETGLITTVSVRYVDGIMEERQVDGGLILRMFHLSPRTRHPRGERLWP